MFLMVLITKACEESCFFHDLSIFILLCNFEYIQAQKDHNLAVIHPMGFYYYWLSSRPIFEGANFSWKTGAFPL